jgi:subfamily B ATP-binding cassette protein MsbA
MTSPPARVTVNGRDIRELKLHDLRSKIALVTQEPFLFDDTLAANIAYGRPGATAEEIVAAARPPPPTSSSPPCRRLRHPRRRGGPAPVRRPAPAHRHRPRLPEGRPHPVAR